MKPAKQVMLSISGTLLFIAACAARSEAELQAEFRAFVDAHNQCASTDECVLANASCPLGCSAAVNAQFRGIVEQKAAELVHEYESSGRGCDYECAAVIAVCSEGRCSTLAQ